MGQDELLRFVVKTLERLGVEYFVTGSIATIFYGEPRFTNDIDVVVDLAEARVEELCAAFPADDFYLSPEAARRAVRSRTQFNIIHPTSGLKIDVLVAKGDAFDRSRFQRVKRLTPGPDYRAAFASPEDVILKKMEYFKEGGAQKHLRDIAGVLEIWGKSTGLDEIYIESWASRLGLIEIWRAIREAQGP